MNLTLKDIEYFVAMVEHGSLARAGQVLGITQPALSKSLKRVEAETGLALFHRDSRPLQLTTAGLTFLTHARRLHAEYAGAVRNVTELRTGQAGLLRIGATGATLDALVLPALNAMLPLRPAMRVQLHVDLSDTLAQSVEQGSLDLALVPTYAATAPPATLARVHLGPDALHLMTGTASLRDRTGPVSVEALRAQRWVLPKPGSGARAMLDAGLAELGLHAVDAVLELDFISEGVMALAKANGFLVVAPGASLARAQQAGLWPIRLDPRLQRHLHRDLSLLGRDRVTRGRRSCTSSPSASNAASAEGSTAGRPPFLRLSMPLPRLAAEQHGAPMPVQANPRIQTGSRQGSTRRSQRQNNTRFDVDQPGEIFRDFRGASSGNSAYSHET